MKTHRRLRCRPILGIALATLVLASASPSIVAPAGAELTRPGPAPLSLSDAIRLAVKGSPAAQAAAFDAKASAARVAQVRSGLLPQLNFSETFNRTNNPMWAFGTKLNQETITLADFNPVQLNDPDTITNFATALSLEWSLLDLSRTWIPLRQAAKGLSAAEAVSLRARQETIAQVVIAYTGLLLAQEHLNLIHKSLATATTHMKLVDSRYRNGFVVKSDLLRSQVRIAHLEQARHQAESNIAISQAHLSAAMGEPVEQRFDPVDPLAAGSRIEEPIEGHITAALANRPDLRAMRLREEAAQAEIKKHKATHLPSLHLVGNYEMNSDEISGSADNYTIGAVLRLNLFSGNRIAAQTREAEAALMSVRAMTKALEDGIRVDTRKQYAQAQSAWNRIQVSQAAIALADEGLRIVRNRYEAGLLTIVALLDAETALQQSRMNHFQAVHDHRIAAARLALARGTIDVDFK